MFVPPPGTYDRLAVLYTAVERRGELATVQDEMTWYMGTIALDLTEGGTRWNQAEERMLGEIRHVVSEGQSDCSQVARDANALQRFGRGDHSPEINIEIPVLRLMVAVLEWLGTHREPMRLLNKVPIK